MSSRIVKLGEVTPQRWRNGGGVTRELLALPSPQDWRARVSVADVDRDGPFSLFPGVDRWFCVIEGAGVELVIDGVSHRLQRCAAPLKFSGAAAVDCRLIDGPTRDLNLMLRGCSGGMFAVKAGEPWQPQAASCGLFAAVDGICTTATRRIDVPALSLLWFDEAPAQLAFATAADGNCGWWLAATTREGGG